MVHGNNCPEKYITFDGRCTTCGEQLFSSMEMFWKRDRRGVERPKFATGGIVRSQPQAMHFCMLMPGEEVVALPVAERFREYERRIAELEAQVKQLREALEGVLGVADGLATREDYDRALRVLKELQSDGE